MFTKDVKLSGKTKQYLAASAGGFGFFAISVTYCWVTPTLALIASDKTPLKATPYEASGLSIAAELGMCTLALLIASLANSIGRKPLLLATGPITAATWILVYITNDIYVLLVMRFVQGAMLGIFMGVLPIYTSEISDASIRGSLSSISSIFWNIGFLYTNLLAPVVSYRLHLILTCLPNVIFPFIFYWFHETPHYYLFKGLEDKAIQSLASFRDADYKRELESIRSYVAEERQQKANWSHIFTTHKGRKALVLICVLCVQMSVITIQITFLSQDSRDFNNGTASTYLPSILYGFCAIFFSILANRLLDILGRKPLFVVPTILNSILMFIVFIFLLLSKKFYLSSYWYLPEICNVLGLMFNSFGSPTSARLYQSELFSTPARSFACAITNIFTGLCTSLFAYLFELCQVNDALYAIFLIFGISSAFNAVYIWFTAPETKGKTFQEIQNDL